MVNAQTLKESKIEYPEDILLTLKEEETEFLKELKRLGAIKFYELKRLSLGKAAELADMDRVEFIKLLGQHNVSIFRLSKEDLLRDIENA